MLIVVTEREREREKARKKNERLRLDDKNDWARIVTMFSSFLFLFVNFLKLSSNQFPPIHLDIAVHTVRIASEMLSYLTPTTHASFSASDLPMPICSSSPDAEDNKTNYEPHMIMFNTPPVNSCTRFPYYQSPTGSFIYGHQSTVSHGFNFGLYDDVSPMMGKHWE